MRPLLYRSYLDNFLSYRGEEKSRSVTLLYNLCSVVIRSGFYKIDDGILRFLLLLLSYFSFSLYFLAILLYFFFTSSLLLLYFFFTSSIDRSMVKI